MNTPDHVLHDKLQAVQARIAAACAGHMKKVQLEMGGKNPQVVLDDADLNVAVELSVQSAFYSTGQRCTASSRLIVTDKIYPAFIDAMQARMPTLCALLVKEAFKTWGDAVAEVREAVAHVLEQLNQGTLRVAQKDSGSWVVNQWVKKAVLLSFRLEDNLPMPSGEHMQFYDKVPTKFANYTAEDFAKGGFRVVPPAVARRGSFIGKNVVLMPSYVNIGAYVDEGAMVDTWATVGSCAQIGKNVHLSGGVGIGGVLEPMQANPTIIEDNCFIGARSEVVEGVIVEENSVLAMGVFLSQSTRIYDRETKEIHYGRVPSGSVVVPGSLPSADGTHSLNCAIIVKRVDAQTRAKTSINDLLRA